MNEEKKEGDSQIERERKRGGFTEGNEEKVSHVMIKVDNFNQYHHLYWCKAV